jgi:hypothetical protein
MAGSGWTEVAVALGLAARRIAIDDDDLGAALAKSEPPHGRCRCRRR